MHKHVMIIHCPTMFMVDCKYKQIINECKKYSDINVISKYGTKTINIENTLVIKLTATAHIEREFLWYNNRVGMNTFETQSNYVRQILSSNGFTEIKNGVECVSNIVMALSMAKGGMQK